MNLLMPYITDYEHDDPMLNEFTYGDINRRANELKSKLNKGDYVFFHIGFRGKKYISAYYVIDRVLDTKDAVKDKNIVAKYKNPHITEFISGKRTIKDIDVIIFGDPITSRNLKRPLLFDKALAEKLSLNIKFPKGRTDTECISSATRAWRELNDKDVIILQKEIKKSEEKGIESDTILSTDEVTEIIEKDLENFIVKNTKLIGTNIKLVRRQMVIPNGRIDLMFEDKDENPIVVELKIEKIGRVAVNQIRRYMKWIEKETEKKPTGIIVCKGVMPSFEEEFRKLKNIKIYRYGWKLKVFQLEEE